MLAVVQMVDASSTVWSASMVKSGPLVATCLPQRLVSRSKMVM